MWTKLYWAQVFERAVKTFMQAVAALLAADQAGLAPLPTGWRDVLEVAALAAVASVVTSILSTPTGATGSPSLVPTPAEAGLDRLAAVVRGLVSAVRHAPAVPQAVVERTERAADVLHDLRMLRP